MDDGGCGALVQDASFRVQKALFDSLHGQGGGESTSMTRRKSAATPRLTHAASIGAVSAALPGSCGSGSCLTALQPIRMTHSESQPSLLKLHSTFFLIRDK